jgi:hypothetical protein
VCSPQGLLKQPGLADHGHPVDHGDLDPSVADGVEASAERRQLLGTSSERGHGTGSLPSDVLTLALMASDGQR